jgi:hypothetical protein
MVTSNLAPEDLGRTFTYLSKPPVSYRSANCRPFRQQLP